MPDSASEAGLSAPGTALQYPALPPPAIGDGTATAIADGVLWLRMPVPGRLQAINVWALADGEGWTLVDTGLTTPETKNAWRSAMAGVLAGRPIGRIIVTHMHPDHSGCAGWLAQEHGARLCMTAGEFRMLSALADQAPGAPSTDTLSFYRRAGWDDVALAHYTAHFGQYGRMISPLPAEFDVLQDGQSLTIGDRQWQVVVGRGHSPEHAMLFCEQAGLLISGDQILPHISSNVSQHPLEPEGDPLGDWLASLYAIPSRVSSDALVLPAHGKPFIGVEARLGALVNEHEHALAALLGKLKLPQRAIDVFGVLFKRPIDEATLLMATGESLAHLKQLVSRNQARRYDDAAGVSWWRAV